MSELTLEFSFSTMHPYMSNERLSLDEYRMESKDCKDISGPLRRDQPFQSNIQTLRLRINLKKSTPIYRAKDDIKDEIKRYPNLKRVEVVQDNRIADIWSSEWWSGVKQQLVKEVGGDGRSGRPTIEFSSATWEMTDDNVDGWANYSVCWRAL